MPKRRQKAGGRGLRADELRSQQGLELPERHAMSLLSGMPSLDGGLLGGTPTDTGTGTPTDTGTSPDPATSPADPGPTTEPGPTSGETQTFAPVNRATVLNQLSNGSVQGSSSSQTTPISQSS